ncbi:MAG: DUF3795 domain-containing protein [Patescibacteria group bacterium]
MKKNKTKLKSELIAPCGMNCGLCKAYMGFALDMTKDQRKKHGVGQCSGCRARGKMCAFLKRDCFSLKNNKIKFCHQCKKMPCQNLIRLDKSYKEKYQYSFVSNQEQIKKQGIKRFLASQERKYRCPKCGGLICIHDKKCYYCRVR